MSGIFWLLAPLTFASLLGIIINSYILLVVIGSLQYSTINNILLIHLVTLNLCLGGTFLFFSAPGLVCDTWLSDGIFCHLHGFLFTILHPLILWTVCGLNADRYYAIVAPLHYGHLVNPKKVFICLGVGWFTSLIFSTIPLLQIAPFAFNHGLGACAPNFQAGRATLWYSAAYTAFTLLLPITLIICFNAKILMIARYHRHRIASAIFEVTLSAQVTITHQRNPFFVPTVTAPGSGGPKFHSRSPVSSVLQLLGSIVLLYVPYYSIILWESCVTFLELEPNPKDHEKMYQIVLVLLTLSPAINGFLYGLRNKTLRKTFQNYWRKKLSKSEVNQEILARTPSTCGSRRQSLTPALGFFARPILQRRQSEAVLDTHRCSSKDIRNKIKRIASEATWRPRSDISMTTLGALQAPTANISECRLDIDLDDLERFHPVHHERVKFSIQDPIKEISKDKLDLATYNGTTSKAGADDKDESKKKKSFLSKLFGLDETAAPKILITRALSEDDYSKNMREPSKHSLSVSNSLSKWYHHSDYNLIKDHAEDDPISKTQLLFDHHDQVGEVGPYHQYEGPASLKQLSEDSDDDSENSTDNSENSTGIYMNLDSLETLGTETETGECSYGAVKLMTSNGSNLNGHERQTEVEHILMDGGSLHLNARELNAMDNKDVAMKTIEELKDINHEVVL